MKRYAIIIFGLLLCYDLSAQTTRTCRYWFDGNFGQSMTTSFSGNTWDGQIDVSQLPDGIHTLQYYLTDSTSTPVRSYFFHKVSTVGASALQYRYWFDNRHDEMHSGAVGNGTFQLYVTGLTTGIHTLHLVVKDENYSATRSYLFIKTEVLGDVTYHCWFDEDESTGQTGSVGDGNIVLDVTGLENGEHTLFIYLEGTETMTDTETYVFMNNLAVDEYDNSSLVLYPNPVEDRLMIEGKEVIRLCEVYTLAGELLLTFSLPTDKAGISVESLPAGTYLIRLVSESFAKTCRFIKR